MSFELGRRWKTVILILIMSTAAGFFLSYVFPAKYTSQSLVLIVSPPQADVLPSAIKDLSPGLAAWQQGMLSRINLQAMLERIDSRAESAQDMANMIDHIYRSIKVEPVLLDQNNVPNEKQDGVGGSYGFYVKYTDSNPHRAQQICNELTTTMLQANMESNLDEARKSHDRAIHFLRTELDATRAKLKTFDSKLAVCRKGRASSSRASEVKCKELARDYDATKNFFSTILSKLQQADLAIPLERDFIGGNLRVLSPASLPLFPDFPNRLRFAGAGFCVGLIFVIGRKLWPSRKT